MVQQHSNCLQFFPETEVSRCTVLLIILRTKVEFYWEMHKSSLRYAKQQTYVTMQLIYTFEL
jgi:hypothetical protein